MEEGGRRYVLCRNPSTREALLAKTEEKLAALERLVVTGRLKRKEKILARVLRWINRWKVEPYFRYTVEEGSFTFCRDQERITQKSHLDGCYVIVTSLSASGIAVRIIRYTQSRDYPQKITRSQKNKKSEWYSQEISIMSPNIPVSGSGILADGCADPPLKGRDGSA
ncbi:MAG: hypothetical protein NTX88_07900 [Candidatus Atribacteria bacterium]|nr:hypothetical protein [Candidatus Atribacteria bacterium]